jgi:hypothetical protein
MFLDSYGLAMNCLEMATKGNERCRGKSDCEESNKCTEALAKWFKACQENKLDDPYADFEANFSDGVGDNVYDATMFTGDLLLGGMPGSAGQNIRDSIYNGIYDTPSATSFLIVTVHAEALRTVGEAGNAITTPIANYTEGVPEIPSQDPIATTLNTLSNIGTFGPPVSQGLIDLGNTISSQGTEWVRPSQDESVRYWY